MRTLYVFFAIAAVIIGAVSVLRYLRIGDAIFIDFVIGVGLLACGLTYLWKLSGFRGLNSK